MPKITSVNPHPYLDNKILNSDQKDSLIRFVNLRKQLHQFVDQFKGTYAVFFEYLPTGVTIGINEKNVFPPASLVKVPLAMAFYNGVEDRGINENKIITIQNKDLDNKFGTLWEKGPGYKISLKDVVKIMLQESDNTAYNIMANNIEDRDFADIYNGLDLEYDEKGKFIITAKGYSSILASLYFSAILNYAHSNMLLDYLAHTNFNDQLVAGIPKNIKVSHKIGANDALGIYQDCGIVYLPKRPYILCMISSSSHEEATQRMVNTSKMVYDYISSVP